MTLSNASITSKNSLRRQVTNNTRQYMIENSYAEKVPSDADAKPGMLF